MKKFKFLILLFTISMFIACGDDDSQDIQFDYHVHIHAPNTDDKHVNDDMEIDIEFESHSGETVHHVKVIIYKKDDNTNIVYSGPSEAHVHEESGKYTFEDNLTLSEANGFSEHTDWVLEAKVWGHEAGVEEMVETVEFHVHPE